MLLLKRYLPALILIVLIFASSSQPGATVSSYRLIDVIAHKTAHLFLYSILCLTFYRATKNVIASIILTVIYGILDELHQQFVPTRSGNNVDIMVDTVAALFTGIILWKYLQNLPTKLKNWLLE